MSKYAAFNEFISDYNAKGNILEFYHTIMSYRGSDCSTLMWIIFLSSFSFFLGILL